jgi:hypothetical protein
MLQGRGPLGPIRNSSSPNALLQPPFSELHAPSPRPKKSPGAHLLNLTAYRIAPQPLSIKHARGRAVSWERGGRGRLAPSAAQAHPTPPRPLLLFALSARFVTKGPSRGAGGPWVWPLLG